VGHWTIERFFALGILIALPGHAAPAAREKGEELVDQPVKIEEVELPESHGVAIRETHAIADLPAFFMGAFPELGALVESKGLAITAPPFARYFNVSESTAEVEVVMPTDAPCEGEGRVHPVNLPACRAIQALHVGPYEALHPVYQAVEQWLGEHGKVATDAVREVYLNGPGEVAGPEDLRTLVVQPYAEA
jgi:effector-binding domain-containing protein